MKFLVRWAFRFLILFIVLAVALVLLKDVLAKAFAEYQIEAQTGMNARIGRLELGLFTPTVTVEDLKIYNPADFGGSPMWDVPDLHLEYVPAALLRRQLHLKLVRLALAELNIVESRDGRTNLIVAPGLLGTIPSGNSTRESIFGLDFAGIETLNLTLGKIRYSSLRQPGRPTEVRLDLKNEVLTHLQSIKDLTNAVLKTAFRNGITILTDPAPSPAAGKSGRKGGGPLRK